MKNWNRFLEKLGDAKQVYVVGPMMGRPFKPTAPTIYVDGGAVYQQTIETDGNIPTVSVGDGDSTKLKLDVPLPIEKDYSDLAFVLHYLPETVRHVELLGFQGGRPDHELINYGEVNKFLRDKKVFTTVRFEESIVAFSGGSLKLHIDGLFSVVVLEKAEVRIIGACKYPLNVPTKIDPASSLGLGNMGHGTVVFESTKPCFLFLG
ncbi:MAG: hypothetical protein ACXWQE_13730 [Bdellovibrionales bacterium]